MLMDRSWQFSSSLLVPALFIAGCLTNVPDPALGSTYACVDDSDCPGTQTCLQQVCEAVELPVVKIVNPEDEKPYTYTDGAAPHAEVLNLAATNLVLRELSESSEAVAGEGHLVVFVDEIEVALIDSGDLSGGVQVPIEIPDVPGVHRIRVQARLNDGTDYDNETARARNLVWVDDKRIHVALRSPWPGESFSLESQPVQATVAVLGDVSIGPPSTGLEHVHVHYGDSFPACLDDPLCVVGYVGIVPSNDDEFGPVFLPKSAAGMVTLTALIKNSDHTTYLDDMEEPVWSEIQILRTND
ncbi:hypothetical protein ENSA5_23220 [Enhygromyxa salina]|uniref:Uncharacterized protein n=1 Tax=Enhygromyxa salina TaxID=215803 RepID=A0A2S9YBB4_9BACT|nr:hypothetical protein [Enhygromyxa salina]PRQ02395.1 hypothetical protein ENSA5_23220 [Enhygromyxa salina]